MKKITTLLITAVLSSAMLLAQQVDVDKVPAPVLKAFKTKFPKASEPAWEMMKKKYDVKFVNNQSQFEALFDKSGKWIETEILMDIEKLPKSVSKSVTSEDYKDFSIIVAKQVTDQEGKHFKLVIEKTDEKLLVDVSDGGEIIEEAPIKK